MTNKCGCKGYCMTIDDSTAADPNAVRHEYHVDFCPKHAAVDEMVEMLKEISDILETEARFASLSFTYADFMNNTKALLDKIGGE